MRERKRIRSGRRSFHSNEFTGFFGAFLPFSIKLISISVIEAIVFFSLYFHPADRNREPFIQFAELDYFSRGNSVGRLPRNSVSYREIHSCVINDY